MLYNAAWTAMDNWVVAFETYFFKVKELTDQVLVLICLNKMFGNQMLSKLIYPPIS